MEVNRLIQSRCGKFYNTAMKFQYDLEKLQQT